MSEAMFPRDVTADEQAVLDFVLGHEWEGAEQVRSMLRDTRATGTCSCKCGSIDLTVSPPREPLRSPRIVPIDWIGYVDGKPVTVLLFAEADGAYLEFVWYDDDRPERLPSPEELEVAKWGPDGALLNDL